MSFPWTVFNAIYRLQSLNGINIASIALPVYTNPSMHICMKINHIIHMHLVHCCIQSLPKNVAAGVTS
jgi:hypothetical protein